MTTLHGVEVKVGDKVWDSTTGWDEVVAIYEEGVLGIVTQATNYDEAGYYLESDKNPSLFWQEFEIPKQAFEKPKVKRYLVLYEYNKLFYTTANTLVAKYYLSKEDFCKGNPSPNNKFISLIMESEMEFDE